MSADRLAALLGRARAICDDRALRAVRAWKEANPKGLAIGYMPVYVPRPLFEAQGCLPVAVFGGGDQVDIIRGDSYFQSYICHLPRSTIELALGGDLDALDGMVFPAICDVIRNLGGMWKLLFPQKLAFYLDLPQNFARGLGGRFYAQELRRVARELEARGARKLRAAELRLAIDEENERRSAVERLDDLRRKEPWRLRASEAYVAVRAGGTMTTTDHRAFLEDVIAAARARPVRALDNVRVVLTGSFCEQPPLDLVVALEKAGCDIVDDDFQLGLRFLTGPIDAPNGTDPIDALAHAYVEKGRETASRYIGPREKGADLVARVRASGADGVILAAASFCDPALLDQPMLEAALDRAGIPHTSFKFAENTGQFQVIREQAGAFSDAVKLWGELAPQP